MPNLTAALHTATRFAVTCVVLVPTAVAQAQIKAAGAATPAPVTLRAVGGVI